MAFTPPKNGKPMPLAVARTFMNTSHTPAALPNNTSRGGRGGVKVLVKNPFQGAINKEAMSLKKY